MDRQHLHKLRKVKNILSLNENPARNQLKIWALTTDPPFTKLSICFWAAMSGGRHWRFTPKTGSCELESRDFCREMTFNSFTYPNRKGRWENICFGTGTISCTQKPLREITSLYDLCEILSGWWRLVVVVVVVVVVWVSNHQQVAEDMSFWVKRHIIGRFWKQHKEGGWFYLGEFLHISQNLGNPEAGGNFLYQRAEIHLFGSGPTTPKKPEWPTYKVAPKKKWKKWGEITTPYYTCFLGPPCTRPLKLHSDRFPADWFLFYTLWQTNIAGWNIPIFNRKYIFKGPVFHCYRVC